MTEPRFRDAAEGRLQRLREPFAGFGGLVRDYLACLKSNEPIHYGPIEWLELDRWHAGRVVLESRAVGEMLRKPSNVRNAALRERGKRSF